MKIGVLDRRGLNGTVSKENLHATLGELHFKITATGHSG
jgi:hypothetical protein